MLQRGFSLLEWEVTDKQAKEARMITVLMDQIWRYKFELMFSLIQIHVLTYRNIYRNVYIQASIQTNIFLTDESSGNNTSVAMAIMPIYSFHYSSPIKGTPWRNRVWPEKRKICRMCLSTCSTGN